MGIHNYLVSWCFEPSQPLRVISGLKTNFSLSLSYFVHKSLDTNHNFLRHSENISHKKNTTTLWVYRLCHYMHCNTPKCDTSELNTIRFKSAYNLIIMKLNKAKQKVENSNYLKWLMWDTVSAWGDTDLPSPILPCPLFRRASCELLR